MFLFAPQNPAFFLSKLKNPPTHPKKPPPNPHFVHNRGCFWLFSVKGNVTFAPQGLKRAGHT